MPLIIAAIGLGVAGVGAAVGAGFAASAKNKETAAQERVANKNFDHEETMADKDHATQLALTQMTLAQEWKMFQKDHLLREEELDLRRDELELKATQESHDYSLAKQELSHRITMDTGYLRLDEKDSERKHDAHMKELEQGDPWGSLWGSDYYYG